MRDIITKQLSKSGMSHRAIGAKINRAARLIDRYTVAKRDVGGEVAGAIIHALGGSVATKTGHAVRGLPSLREIVIRQAAKQRLGPQDLAKEIECHRATMSRYLRRKQDCGSLLVAKLLKFLNLRIAF